MQVHRDLVGWIINKLEESGIQAKRTTGSNEKGDSEISNRNTMPQVKKILCQVREQLDSSLTSSQQNNDEIRLYLEVKAYTSKKVDSTLAKKLIQKETIFGIVTTGKITKPAKTLLDKAEIVWIEEFPESYLNFFDT